MFFVTCVLHSTLLYFTLPYLVSCRPYSREDQITEPVFTHNMAHTTLSGPVKCLLGWQCYQMPIKMFGAKTKAITKWCDDSVPTCIELYQYNTCSFRDLVKHRVAYHETRGLSPSSLAELSSVCPSSYLPIHPSVWRTLLRPALSGISRLTADRRSLVYVPFSTDSRSLYFKLQTVINDFW